MGKQKNRFTFESVNLVSYIWMKRKPLIWIGIIAIIVSAAVSYMIKPKFKSTVVLFPASSLSVSKTIFNTITAKEDLLRFGGQEEGEQLMQILESSEIRGQIIRDFHLAKRYRVDTTARTWRSELNDIYEDNISYHRTEYMSVVITVLDHQPDTAAMMANEISSLVDTVYNRVKHDRAVSTFNLIQKQYTDIQNRMTVLEDSINYINKIGVVGFDGNAFAYHKAYAKALANGKTSGIRTLENKLKLISKYEVVYNKLNNLLSIETQKLRELKEPYIEAKAELEHNMPQKFVVDKAYPADKKASPKRLLIVLISTFAALFFTLLIMSVQDRINYNKEG